MPSQPLLQRAHAAAAPAPALRPAVPPSRLGARRRRWIDRRAVGELAGGVDFAAAGLLSLVLVEAPAGLGALTLAEALPHALLPLAAVGGVGLLRGRRFRYAGSARLHLLRTGAGAAGGTAAAALVCAAASPAMDLTLTVMLAVLLTGALLGLHAVYIAAIRMLTHRGHLCDNAVIVGATPTAARLIAANARERELNILGYFDDRTARRPVDLGAAPHLGGVDDLLSWSRLPDVDRIIVTVPSTAQARVRDLIDRLRAVPQEVILVLDLEGFNPEQTSLGRIVDAPAAYVSGAPRDFRRAVAKRAFDIAGVALIGLLAAPLIALIAVLIRLDSPGPVLFRQRRFGFHNEVIRVWKFRTMKVDPAAERGHIVQTLPMDPRVTRIGRFLRAASLDELPQLFNVLIGEMSLVGPRPHAVGMTAEAVEVHALVAGYAHRHRVKPGLTGWAQINGSRGPVHTAEGVRERVRLDRWYIANASIWLDLYIVLMTLPRLLGDRRPR